MLHESREDYWEDASVSLGCNHEWDSTFSTPLQMQEEADGCKKAVNAPEASLQSNDSQKNSYASLHIAEHSAASSAKRLHNFPPPITFCVTLSIKEGGRFVLKETDARPSLQSCFRAERTEGRLCLHLVEPEQLDEDLYDDSKLWEAQYLDGGVQYSFMAAHEDGGVQYSYMAAHGDDTAPHDCGYKHLKDDIDGNVESMSGSNLCDSDVNMKGDGKFKLGIDPDVIDDADDGESKRGNNICAVYAASALNTDVQLDCIDYSTLLKYEGQKQEALKSRSNEEGSRHPMGIASEVLSAMERGPLRSVNDMAPHIQSLSPNELSMRRTFTNMSPSLGLTVS